MKTIGLLGGMSWESTAIYYRLLNEGVRSRLGGQHSARLLLWSFDFAEIESLQASGDWQAGGERLAAAAQALESAGAELLLIGTNTMHKVAEAVETSISIPMLHIADATGEALKRAGATRPLLLATRYTMEEDFYKGRLQERHELDVVVPDAAGREEVHRIIYDELCQGVVSPQSKSKMLEIARAVKGVDSIILGCTEVGLLISQDDFERPVIDTTKVHVSAALDAVL